MLGKKIKMLRLQRNLTQEQLARELNVSRQAVAKWEVDGGMPDIDNIKALAKFFNQSLDEFINDLDESNLIKVLTRRIMVLFLGIAFLTILLIEEFTVNNLIVWFLFVSFMFVLSWLVRVMIIRFYNCQIKKKAINRDDLGKLLVKGVGESYLDPDNNFKAVYMRIKVYWENAFILGYLQGLIMVIGDKISDYQMFVKKYPEIAEVSFKLSDLRIIIIIIVAHLLINIMVGEWRVYKYKQRNKC